MENLRNTLNDQINKLDQLRNVSNQAYQPNNNQTNNPQPQRYYLDCGVKEDWQQFLKLNYGITENQIFEDYKLFLQAKAELHEDANKEKLEAMKNKLASKQKEPKIRNVNDTSANSNQSINRNNKQSTEISKNINTNKGV